MTTRQLLTTLMLAVAAVISLLTVFVFIDEPGPVGGAAPEFHPADIAYLVIPFALMAAAAWTPVRVLLRRRRDRQA